MKNILLLFLIQCTIYVTVNTQTIEKLINYQGVLKKDGQQVQDGEYQISFRLYTSLTGVDEIWSEAQTVTVKNGVFNCYLGSIESLNGISFNQSYYLGIKVGAEQEFSERILLTPAAYAMMSMDIMDNTISNTKLQDNSVTLAKLHQDIVTAGGDLEGSYPNPKIVKIQGRELPGPDDDPEDGQILKWDIGQSKWIFSKDNSETGTGGGTVERITAGTGLTGGSILDTGTIGIASNGITSNMIQDNSIISDKIENGAVTQSKLSSNVTTVPSGIAEGDLSGIYPNPEVSRIKGMPISKIGLDTNDVLKWDGEQWKPSEDLTSSSSSGGTVTRVNTGTGLTGGPITTNGTISIANNGITEAMLQTNSVNSSKISNSSINAEDIASAQVLKSINGFKDNVFIEAGNSNISIENTQNRIRIFGIGGSGGIQGSGSSNYIPKFSGATTLGNSNMYQTTNGNIGIGTVNPDSRLHIVDSNGGSGELFSNADGLIVENAGSSNDYFVFQTATVGGGKSFAITNAGNVGIGADISNLEYKLELGKTTESENYMRIMSNEWAGLLFYDASITAKTNCGAVSYAFEDKNNPNKRIGLFFDTKSSNTKLPITRLRIDEVGVSHFLDENEETVVEISHSPSNAGVINIFGPNGKSNLILTSNSNNVNHGLFEVRNDVGSSKAGIFVSSGGEGIVWGDQMQFSVDNPDENGTEIRYSSISGPEVASFIRGTAKLINGTAEINLPDHFSVVTSNQNITVNTTPLSADSKGLAVIEKSNIRIKVVELFGGRGNYDFDYVVMGRKGGYENYEVIQEKLNSTN